MTKSSVFILLTLTSVLLSATPTTSNAGPATRPTPVSSAQSVLEDWVNQLRGSTEKQIVEKFGHGGERSMWQSGDEKGVQLRYRFGLKSKLDLLFSDDRVVYIDFTVSSS